MKALGKKIELKRKRAAEDELLRDGVMHPDDAKRRHLPDGVKTYDPVDETDDSADE